MHTAYMCFQKQTSVCIRHTCIIKKQTSVYTWHTCVFKKQTSVYTWHTCVFKKQTSVYTWHTCIIKKQTSVCMRKTYAIKYTIGIPLMCNQSKKKPALFRTGLKSSGNFMLQPLELQQE